MAFGLQRHLLGAILRVGGDVVGRDRHEAHPCFAAIAPELHETGADVHHERTMVADERDDRGTAAPQVGVADDFARARIGQLEAGKRRAQLFHGGSRGHRSPREFWAARNERGWPAIARPTLDQQEESPAVVTSMGETPQRRTPGAGQAFSKTENRGHESSESAARDCFASGRGPAKDHPGDNVTTFEGVRPAIIPA